MQQLDLFRNHQETLFERAYVLKKQIKVLFARYEALRKETIVIEKVLEDLVSDYVEL